MSVVERSENYHYIDLGPQHLVETEDLLKQCGLPFDDCAEHINHFIGVVDDGKLVAVGGIQLLPHCALLRSVAVLAAYRGHGIGRKIIDRLVSRLVSYSIREIYLLTETAADYFTPIGFFPLEKSLAPAQIRRTKQFSEICPSSATLMRWEI